MCFMKKIVAAAVLLALCECKPALDHVVAAGDRQQNIGDGKEARPHIGPWYVTLQYRGRPLCGGSILAADIVVTAAHCFGLSTKTRDYEILAGPVYWPNVASDVQSIEIHPKYDEDRNSNDLALIKLVKPVPFSDSISPICLPDRDVLANEPAEALFWGETRGTGSNRPLLPATVPIISIATANDRAHYNGRIDETMIAAGSGGKGACVGVDGAPLVVKRNDTEDRWMLVGIASWGIDCDQDASRPGVYARVRSGIGWITSAVQSLSASHGLPADCGHQAVKDDDAGRASSQRTAAPRNQ
jgi:secreted trypsin-like serine protease